MNYTKEYFIKKFEAIPEELWTIDKYVDINKYNCYCALGHCGETSEAVTEESSALSEILLFVAQINDGVGKYAELGDTPKQRILTALRLLP